MCALPWKKSAGADVTIRGDSNESYGFCPVCSMRVYVCRLLCWRLCSTDCFRVVMYLRVAYSQQADRLLHGRRHMAQLGVHMLTKCDNNYVLADLHSTDLARRLARLECSRIRCRIM